MNFELIGHLIRLRYKLMWAKTRSRSGKLALFVLGYLLLILLVMLFTSGGFGAGLAAVRTGRARMVAEVVLSALYFEALMCSVMLGFGINAVFSEAELRRYPLNAAERLAARHLTAMLDPFWYLVLALELGLLVGLYAMGAAPFWPGLAAILLLAVSNYQLARAVALAVERLMGKSWGNLVLLGVILGLGLLPGTLAPVLRRNPALAGRIVHWLGYTPPFGAAAALTGTLSGFAILLFWVTAFLALVIALERHPSESRQAVVKGPLDWSRYYERVGGVFGPANAPLVGHWLRFYMRNRRFRALYVLAIPLAGFLTFQLGQRPRGPGFFVAALGAFPLTAFLGTSRIAVNLFGYAGGGLRRYFLLPTDPADSLRAGSYASVLLGGASVLVATLVWMVLAPVSYGVRMLAMLVASGTIGLFFFHGAGLWTTLYGARRGDYSSGFGNDMSLAGNLVTIGSAMGSVFLPQALVRLAPAWFSPDHWWLWLAPLALAVLFYLVSLGAVSARFAGRRERLLAVVEGRA